MIIRLGVLHWQEGDGFDMLQFPLRKISMTAWSTGGVNQSDPLDAHGKPLQKNSEGNICFFSVIETTMSI